ncbi:MAG: C25 family cysteine peptidase [Candidatus Thermoplasmatota archaeon]
MFGNAGIIPPSYYIYDSTLQGWYGAYNDWIPTDFFYASPDYDLVPNFKIGRIPVGSNSEANHFVNKVTNWTKFLSVDWFANITLAGGRPFFTPFFVGEMSCIHATEYLSGRIRKCFRTDDTFNEENLKNVFSGEEGIVYHMGHGSGDSIWLETGFWEEDELNASEIMALPQSSKTPIVISVACMNGAFDTDLMKFSWNPFNLSFGEALIKSNAGGISYIGGSRINFGGWNVIFKNGSMHILKEPYMQGMCIDMIRAVNKSSSLGELFEKGITYYVEENDFSDKINNRTLFGTVLLGDPTLPIIKGNGSKYKTYSNITNPYKYVNASKHVYPNFNRTWAGCIGDIPVVLDENVTIECFTSSPKSLIKVVDTDRYGNYTIVKKTEINNFVEKIRLNTSSLYIIRIISDDENETWVYVLRASVIFSDISEDYVVDKDNNGFYDYLQIDVNLTVNKTGGYGVFGVLVVESGGWWWYINSAWLWVILENGMQTVSFKFNGDNIKERINLYNEFGKEWGFNISGNTSFILYTYVLNEEWKLFDYTFTSTSEYNYTRFGVSKNANLKGVIYNSTGNTTEAFIFTYDKETNYRNYTWVNETGKYSINLYPGTFDVIVIGWDENNINDKVFKINVLQDETKIMNIFLPAMRSDNVNEHFNLSSWDDLNLRWLVSWGWLNYTMRWQIDAFLGDDDGNVSEKEKERYKTYVYWYINAWLEFCSGRLKIFGFYVDEREYAIYSINDFSFDIKNLTGIWMSDSPITFDEKIGCKSTKTVPLNQTHKVKLRINYDSKYASYIYRIKYPLPYVMVSYTGENISVSGDNEVVIDPLEYDLWYDWIEMNVTSKDLSSPVINFTPPDTINANTLIPLYANVTDNYYTPDKLIVTAYVNSHPQPMNYVSGNLFSTVIGPFGIGNVKLYIEAKDLSNNTNTTPLIVLEVVDLINPIANGGSDQLVDEDTVVTFDGSASSDNVEIVNYTWTFFDGVWQILYGVSPTYIFYTPGIYVVTLNVSDAAGNWHTDEVIITVMDITPPVANASSDQLVDEDTTVHFDGSASFDNVGIVNYTWTFNDQGTVIILHGVNPWYVFNQPGTYVVTLNVSDAAGNWVVDIVNITVRDITLPKITNLRASPAVQTQNSYVNITCAVEDNVAVSATNVTIKGPVGFAPINITMAKVGNAEYYYNLSYSIAGEYSYYIWVVDISGNGNKSAEYYFIITIAVKRTIEDREVNVVGIGNGTVSIEPTSLPQIPPEKLHNITCIKVTITGTLTYVNITIRYTEEDVAGLNESTLIMYYWDATEGKWKSCNEIGSTGADVENNIVWANVTSLTIFAPMAEKVPEIMPAPVNRLLYIGIGAIVVILAVFVAIAKRKKKLKGAE